MLNAVVAATLREKFPDETCILDAVMHAVVQLNQMKLPVVEEVVRAAVEDNHPFLKFGTVV